MFLFMLRYGRKCPCTRSGPLCLIITTTCKYIFQFAETFKAQCTEPRPDIFTTSLLQSTVSQDSLQPEKHYCTSRVNLTSHTQITTVFVFSFRTCECTSKTFKTSSPGPATKLSSLAIISNTKLLKLRSTLPPPPAPSLLLQPRFRRNYRRRYHDSHEVQKEYNLSPPSQLEFRQSMVH